MAIFLGILAGIGFAAGITTTRIAIDKSKASNELGAIVTLLVAGIVGVIIAFITQIDFNFPVATVWKLVIIGVFAPGITQLTNFVAVRNIGPSRSGIFIGLAPIWGVAGAYLFTSGSLNPAIIIGVLIAFLAGVLLASESLKGTLGVTGVIAGIYTGLGYGARDVVSDELLSGESLNSAFTSGVLWLAGVPPILIYIGFKTLKNRSADGVQSAIGRNLDLKVRLKNIGYLCIPGVIVGLALPAILEALKRGRLEIVTPIANSFAIISGVILASIIFGKQEWGVKVIFSMLMIAGGAVLVGVFG